MKTNWANQKTEFSSHITMEHIAYASKLPLNAQVGIFTMARVINFTLSLHLNLMSLHICVTHMSLLCWAIPLVLKPHVLAYIW